MNINIDVGYPNVIEKTVEESETPIEVNEVVVGYIESEFGKEFKFDDKFREWFLDWVKENCPEDEADAYEVLDPKDAFGSDNPYGCVEEAITAVEEFIFD